MADFVEEVRERSQAMGGRFRERSETPDRAVGPKERGPLSRTRERYGAAVTMFLGSPFQNSSILSTSWSASA